MVFEIKIYYAKWGYLSAKWDLLPATTNEVIEKKLFYKCQR